MSDDDTESASGAYSIGNKTATVKCQEDASGGVKLYEFMKAGRYVNVTLKFDDGQQISCHR